MKIFTIFYLLAGVSFGMPMANQDQDSFDLDMENELRRMSEIMVETQKVMEESLRAIQESNRQTSYMYRNMFKINTDDIEKYGD